MLLHRDFQIVLSEEVVTQPVLRRLIFGADEIWVNKKWSTCHDSEGRVFRTLLLTTPQIKLFWPKVLFHRPGAPVTPHVRPLALL